MNLFRRKSKYGNVINYTYNFNAEKQSPMHKWIWTALFPSKSYKIEHDRQSWLRLLVPIDDTSLIINFSKRYPSTTFMCYICLKQSLNFHITLCSSQTNYNLKFRADKLVMECKVRHDSRIKIVRVVISEKAIYI